jgi:hypothetical protein
MGACLAVWLALGALQAPNAEAAVVTLQNDSGIAASYGGEYKANSIVGAVLTPLTSQLPLRIQSVSVMLYRYPGAASSVQVRARVYALTNGVPSALLGQSAAVSVTTFYPAWASIDLSAQNIVITTAQPLMAAIEYVNGVQGTTPGVTLDDQVGIPWGRNLYSRDGGATWGEHYGWWLDPACAGYNMIRATVETNIATGNLSVDPTITRPVHRSTSSLVAPPHPLRAVLTADPIQGAPGRFVPRQLGATSTGAVAVGRPFGTGKQHVLARDSSGRLHLVYMNANGTAIYYTSSDNNGQSWSMPTLIYRGTSLEGSMAIDGLDRLHLIWGNSSLNNGCALYAHFNGSQWVSPTFLGTWAFGRNIASDSGNRVHAFWSNADVQYTRYQNGVWSAPATIANDAWHPAVTIDDLDRLHVTYNDNRYFSDPSVQARYIRSTNGGLSWSGATNLSNNSQWSASTAIVDGPGGDLHATYVTQNSIPILEGDLNYTHYDGASWSTPIPIAVGGVQLSTPGRESAAMAVDGAGNLFVVFSCRNPLGLWDVCLLAKSHYGWEPVQNLTNNTSLSSFDPSLAYGDVTPAGLDITWGASDGYTYYRNVQPHFPAYHVKIVDPAGKPVSGARLYRNGAPVAATGGALTVTNFDGLLGLDDLQPGEQLVALAPRAQYTTTRAAHDQAADPGFPAGNWAYRVYNTSLANTTIAGPGEPLVVPNPAPSLITLTVSPSNTLVMFNVVASLEWKADITTTQQISAALRQASDYLYTVTDGQMAFERVHIYDDGRHWTDADFQFSAKNVVRPSAIVGGMFEPGGTVAINIGRLWDGLSGNRGAWDHPEGFRTLIHEFGHYGLTLYDEYFYYTYNQSGKLTGAAESDCTSADIRSGGVFTTNASIMDYQYNAAKLAMRDTIVWSPQCLLTRQWQVYGQSDWERLRTVFGDTLTPARWNLITPLERGGVVFGPVGLTSLRLPVIHISGTLTSGEMSRTLQVLPPGPNIGAIVTLYTERNGVIQPIDQGLTNISGTIAVYGAAVSDTVRVASWDGAYAGLIILDDRPVVTLTLAPIPLPGLSARGTAESAQVIRLVPQSNGDLLVNVSGIAGSSATLTARIDQPGGTSLGSAPLAYTDGAYSGQVSLGGIVPGQGTVVISGTDGIGQPVQLATTFSLWRIEPADEVDVRSSDGNLMLHLPAGSFDVPTYVAITTLNVPPGDLGALARPAGSAYEVRFSGSVVTLARPAVMWLLYHAHQPGAATPERLSLFGLDPNLGWQALSAHHDQREQAFVRPVTGSGIFALVAPLPFKVYLPLVLK